MSTLFRGFDFEEFADKEIDWRSQRGELLQRDISPGIETFEEFCGLDLFAGLDFVTVHQAWEHYSYRMNSGKGSGSSGLAGASD